MYLRETSDNTYVFLFNKIEIYEYYEVEELIFISSTLTHNI